jgi:hypothetical protein
MAHPSKIMVIRHTEKPHGRCQGVIELGFTPPASETGHRDFAQVAQKLLDGDQDSVIS